MRRSENKSHLESVCESCVMTANTHILDFKSAVHEACQSNETISSNALEHATVLLLYRVLLQIYSQYFPNLEHSGTSIADVEYLNSSTLARYLDASVSTPHHSFQMDPVSPLNFPPTTNLNLHNHFTKIIQGGYERLLAAISRQVQEHFPKDKEYMVLDLMQLIMRTAFNENLLGEVIKEFGFNITFMLSGPGGAIEEGDYYYAPPGSIRVTESQSREGVMLSSQCARAYLKKLLATLEFITGNGITTFSGHVLSRHRFTDFEGNRKDAHYLGMLYRIAELCSAGPHSVRMAVINSEPLIDMLGLPSNAEHSARDVHLDVIWSLLRACQPQLPRFYDDQRSLLELQDTHYSVEPQPSQFSERGSPIIDGKPGIELITQFPLQEERYFHLIYSAVAAGYLTMVIVNWELLNPRLFNLYQDPRHILLITGFDANGIVTYVDSALPSENMTQRVHFSRLFASLYQGQMSFLNVSTPSSKTPSITELTEGFQDYDLIRTRDTNGRCAESLKQKLKDQHELAVVSQETQSNKAKLAFITAVSDHLEEITELILDYLPECIHADALGSFPGNWVMAFQMSYFLFQNKEIIRATNEDFSQQVSSSLAMIDGIPVDSDNYWQILIKPLIESPDGLKLIAKYLFDRPPYSMPRRYELIKDIITQLPGERKTIFDMGAGMGSQWSDPETQALLSRHKCEVVQLDTLGDDQEAWLKSFAAIYPGDKHLQRAELIRHIREAKRTRRVAKLRQSMSLAPINVRISDYDRLEIAKQGYTSVSIFSFSLHQNRSQVEHILSHAASLMTYQCGDKRYIVTIGEPQDFDNQEFQPEWPIRVYKIQPDGSRKLIDESRVLGPDQMTPLKK